MLIEQIIEFKLRGLGPLNRTCTPTTDYFHVKTKISMENLRVDYLLLKYHRWSPRGRPWPRGRPRGHILKSLALASKVKSLALALRPQVLENWPVLGPRTALFFGMLKFCGALEKFFGKRFLVEIAWKIFVKTFFFFGDRLKNFCEDLFFFFLESTCALCPWSLALASSIPVLGLESVCPRKGCPWPRALCPRLHLCKILIKI